MLKLLRRLAAVIVLTGIACLFFDWSEVDTTGALTPYLTWIPKMQFWPAVMALNIGVVVLMVVVTLLLGRLYCSVVCPLGIVQDVISRIAGWLWPNKTKRKLGRFEHMQTKQLNILRYAVLVVFLIGAVAGIGTLMQMLEPYSIFGRMMTVVNPNIDQPLSNPLVWTAIVSLIVIVGLSVWSGRFYCNNICPVGTVLGLMSKRRIIGIRIDANKCKNCRLCERVCKGSCIDLKTHTIDHTRCVDCFDCLDQCKQSAISFGKAKISDPGNPRNSNNSSSSSSSSEGPTRRAFLAAGATVLGGAVLKAEEKTTDGGIAVILDKKIPSRKTTIVPPGAVSLKHLQQHCTGCQLCVSKCPNHVLRPSSDWTSIMMPESSYEKGFCRPECTVCSDVCPAGAIIKFNGDSEQRKAEKASTKIGTAHWVMENCVVLNDEVSCGLCSRRCPTGAITMVPIKEGEKGFSAAEVRNIPTVDEEKCIGCGACENLCPSRPFSAIYVEGIESQRKI